MTDEQPTISGLELARIVEDFISQLWEQQFIGPCDCCGFPVPSPYFNFDTEELLCRNCRLTHELGGHDGKHNH